MRRIAGLRGAWIIVCAGSADVVSTATARIIPTRLSFRAGVLIITIDARRDLGGTARGLFTAIHGAGVVVGTIRFLAFA